MSYYYDVYVRIIAPPNVMKKVMGKLIIMEPTIFQKLKKHNAFFVVDKGFCFQADHIGWNSNIHITQSINKIYNLFDEEYASNIDINIHTNFHGCYVLIREDVNDEPYYRFFNDGEELFHINRSIVPQLTGE